MPCSKILYNPRTCHLIFNNLCNGLSIKDVRGQEGLCAAIIFRIWGKGFFRCGRPHGHGEIEVEAVRTFCGEGDQFFAIVRSSYGRSLMLNAKQRYRYCKCYV